MLHKVLNIAQSGHTVHHSIFTCENLPEPTQTKNNLINGTTFIITITRCPVPHDEASLDEIELDKETNQAFKNGIKLKSWLP